MAAKGTDAVPGPDTEDGTIKLRLDALSQLFQAFDPAPTHRRRLAPEVSGYIVESAEALAIGVDFRLVFHLPAAEADAMPASVLTEAVHAHFRAQAELERGRKHELFRSGRQALAIGAAVLAICLFASWLLESAGHDSAVFHLAQESFVILGWVIVWRPAEIFLYDWMPIRKQRKLFKRLARAQVVIAPYSDGT